MSSRSPSRRRPPCAIALRIVCDATGWALGQARVPTGDGGLLTRAAGWARDPDAVAGFLRMSEDFAFPPGIGLPGRSRASKPPAWIRDVTVDANFPRAAAAREAGLVAGVIPVLAHDQVECVLELFVFEAREEDEASVEFLSTVAAQLGLLVQRKSAEDALRASEERFRALAETAVDAIVSADARGVITYFNTGAQRIFGYGADEVMGHPLTMLMPERFRQDHVQGLARYQQHQTSARHRRNDRTRRAPKGRGGVPDRAVACVLGVRRRGFAGIIRDITDRKRSEEELATAYEKERRAVQRLPKLDDLKSDFLSTVSHELRTPLTSVLGYAATLVSLWDGIDEGRRKQFLERIASNAQSLDHLINELLDSRRREGVHGSSGRTSVGRTEPRRRERLQLLAQTGGRRHGGVSLADGRVVRYPSPLP